MVETSRLKFIIMDCPTDTTLQFYVAELAKHNVKRVVRVCSPTYATGPLERAGILVHDMPFRDGGTPPAAETPSTPDATTHDATTQTPADTTPAAGDGSTTTSRDAATTGGLLNGNLINVDVKADLNAHLNAPIDGSVAANANAAAPIDASASANVGTVDSDAVALSDQTAIIHQELDGTAHATADQSADVSHSPSRMANKSPPATGSTQGANRLDRTMSTLATTAP